MNKISWKYQEKEENKVVRLNISQFELTKILYSSGILAECSLTPSAKLFLWALCSHYNPNNKTMFPAQQTVAKKLGISEKSAQRAVKELKTCGLIDYETKRVNHYVFGPKFFELVKMSGDIGQNVLNEESQNVRLTKNKEKKEKQNEGFSFNKRGGGNTTYKKGFEQNTQNNLPNRRTPSVEETKKILEERAQISAMSSNPKDFNREEALKWLENIPKFWLKKSKVAEFLVKKYDFREFKEVLNEEQDSAASNNCLNNNKDLKIT